MKHKTSEWLHQKNRWEVDESTEENMDLKSVGSEQSPQQQEGIEEMEQDEEKSGFYSLIFERHRTNRIH